MDPAEAGRPKRGCSVVLALLSLAAAAGAAVAWATDIVPVAIPASLAALILFQMALPARTTPPTVTVPAADSGAELLRKLERLGIPPSTEPLTPQEAMIGGAARAGIARGLDSLEGGRWAEAIERLSPTLDLLSRQTEPRWNKLRGVGYRLRAQAHEGAGRRDDARADFDRALDLAPDDPEARAGKARLTP